MKRQTYYYTVYSSCYRTRYQIISGMERFPQYRYMAPSVAQNLWQACLIFIEWDQVSIQPLYALKAAGCCCLGFSRHQEAPAIYQELFSSLGPCTITSLVRHGVYLHQAFLTGQKKYLSLSWGHDHRYLPLDHIAFLKADNNYTQIYLTEDHSLQAFSTLKSFQQKLPSSFVKVHKSYLIHTRKIRRINFTKREVYFHGQPQTARFPKKYRSVMERIAQHYHAMSY